MPPAADAGLLSEGEDARNGTTILPLMAETDLGRDSPICNNSF
jgi:hypothetical protein